MDGKNDHEGRRRVKNTQNLDHVIYGCTLYPNAHLCDSMQKFTILKYWSSRNEKIRILIIIQNILSYILHDLFFANIFKLNLTKMTKNFWFSWISINKFFRICNQKWLKCKANYRLASYVVTKRRNLIFKAKKIFPQFPDFSPQFNSYFSS